MKKFGRAGFQIKKFCKRKIFIYFCCLTSIWEENRVFVTDGDVKK